MTYRGDADALDRDLADLEGFLIKMGVSSDVRAELVDQTRVLALTPEEDPGWKTKVIDFVVKVGQKRILTEETLPPSTPTRGREGEGGGREGGREFTAGSRS